MEGLEKLGKLGVVPAPTVFTPFVIKQLNIPFVLSLDELIYTHIEFNKIIEKYNLPVFSGVFSLAWKLIIKQKNIAKQKKYIDKQ